MRGLERFGGLLVPLYIGLLDLPDDEFPEVSATSSAVRAFRGSNRQNTAPLGMEEPAPTLTTCGNDCAYLVQTMVESFIGVDDGDDIAQSGGAPRRTDELIPTVTADGAISLVQGHIMRVARRSR